MIKKASQGIVCPCCGGKRFKQEIREVYYRYIDGRGKIIKYEEDWTHDLTAGVILCVKCDTDCSSLFTGIEIE